MLESGLYEVYVKYERLGVKGRICDLKENQEGAVNIRGLLEEVLKRPITVLSVDSECKHCDQ